MVQRCWWCGVVVTGAQLAAAAQALTDQSISPPHSSATPPRAKLLTATPSNLVFSSPTIS